jgi:branched-chain amino acid transport system ATP-binding protein
MTMVETRSAAERLGSVSSGNALELRGVTKMFGALAAIRDVTLTVGSGERRAVLGSNGAGKTTLFNCVTGDFLPTSGTIRLFGEDVTAFPAYERIRRGLRRTYQISLLFGGLTVADNVYLACRGVSRGRFSFLRPRANDALIARADELIEAVHLTPARDTLVANLSYGQQRQLEIALALSGAPRFILFDEPAAGLSPTERGGTRVDPERAAVAHRLHHHRARHGRGAARRRKRDDDAQRDGSSRKARPRRSRTTPRCRSSIWAEATAWLSGRRRRALPRSRCAGSTSTTARPMRCRG